MVESCLLTIVIVSSFIKLSVVIVLRCVNEGILEPAQFRTNVSLRGHLTTNLLVQ